MLTWQKTTSKKHLVTPCRLVTAKTQGDWAAQGAVKLIWINIRKMSVIPSFLQPNTFLLVCLFSVQIWLLCLIFHPFLCFISTLLWCLTRYGKCGVASMNQFFFFLHECSIMTRQYAAGSTIWVQITRPQGKWPVLFSFLCLAFFISICQAFVYRSG